MMIYVKFFIFTDKYGTRPQKKVILRMPKVPESLGPGVMEYWSVEKKTSIL
jgi:hypothetical protein